MIRIDFDRAFAKTPDCIHSAIEMGIRKGQKKMKIQSKIINLAAIAAGLAITIAVAAAAGGFNAAPRPDVLAQPPATDERLHTPEPAPADEESMVYCTDGGRYYHMDEHCSGMQGAIRRPLSEALDMGKDACAVCVTDVSLHLDYIYYSEDEQYMHRMEYCGGVHYPLRAQAANLSSEADASIRKSPCPLCLPNGISMEDGKAFAVLRETSTAAPEPTAENNGGEEPAVYCTEGGKYYHVHSDCSGMLGATLVPLERIAQQKEPCPLCIAPLHVFCTPKGNYYHSDRSCSGMVGATAMSVEEALWWYKQPCPICISSRIVYFAVGGKYYHNEPRCGSDYYEHAGKWLYALSAGMIDCPDCMDEVVSEADENQDAFWAELKAQEEAGPQPFSSAEPPVYITENGIYTHYDSICCGISGAQSLSYAQAQAMGRISCPVCGPNPRERVYATENGKYYHCVENCSGMQRALATTPIEAQWEEKWACPVCMVPYVYELETEGSIRSIADLQRLMPYTDSGLMLNDFVYTALDENCYHLNADCSNSAKEYEMLELALARNQFACPECIGSLPKDIDLFETAFGQDLDALWENWRYSHCWIDDLKVGCYSWIFTNGRDTIPVCSVFDRRTTDNYQLDVYFKGAEDSLRFLQSVTAKPFSHIYPLAMEMAQQHLQDTERYDESGNLYVDDLTLRFDENRQVSGIIVYFKAFDEPFTIEFSILENGEFESSIRS